MNYFIFASIFVFSALLFLIASSTDMKTPRDEAYSPTAIAKSIREGQRNKVLIAHERFGIPLKNTQIAENPNAPKRIYINSQPEETQMDEDGMLFAPVSWFEMAKEIVIKLVNNGEKQ